jgi:hypothetical protein
LSSQSQQSVIELANRGLLEPIANAPRIAAFARQFGVSELLEATASSPPAEVPSVVAGLENFLRSESSLNAYEQRDAIVRLRGLLARTRASRRIHISDLDALHTAAARARTTAASDGLGLGIESVAALMADNVDARVADEMLRSPVGADVTSVQVAGPGRPGPDIRFETPSGRIGREATSITAERAPSVSASRWLRSKLSGVIVDKAPTFDPRPEDPAHYVSRELDIHVRLAADGFSFDPILDAPLINDAIADLPPGIVMKLDRIRFYGSQGNLVFTWSR